MHNNKEWKQTNDTRANEPYTAKLKAGLKLPKKIWGEHLVLTWRLKDQMTIALQLGYMHSIEVRCDDRRNRE